MQTRESAQPPYDINPEAASSKVTRTEDARSLSTSPDLWSADYREAVGSLGTDIRNTIIIGSSAAELFAELEGIEWDATQESTFARGVACLRKVKVPLETFRLALDLASPLGSLEPTTNACFGVVRGFTSVQLTLAHFRSSTNILTQIAISFASADLDFAQQIGDMLQHLQYVDDCDTLGWKTGKRDIHKVG